MKLTNNEKALLKGIVHSEYFDLSMHDDYPGDFNSPAVWIWSVDCEFVETTTMAGVVSSTNKKGLTTSQDAFEGEDGSIALTEKGWAVTQALMADQLKWEWMNDSNIDTPPNDGM